MNLLPRIAANMAEHIDPDFKLSTYESLGGGCISAAYRLDGENGASYFVKTNTVSQYDMFAAEAEGLQAMSATNSITVPRPYIWDIEGNYAYLVMEYLPMGRGGSGGLLGEQLATMHHATRAQFGWHRDNTIGSTAQINTPVSDWVTFWRHHRLGYQLQLAAQNGFGGTLQDKGFRLLDSFHQLFAGITLQPSLLHGDLWSGNYAYMPNGMPVIFDPAVYYGDREADIAMTELFGGFGRDFYDAYNASWPLDSGYRQRKTLYNLYHILNHANLFGGGYARQAEGMIDKLLSEL
ncbi:MAG: fructosamine kinase family protein [Gammaproteobacteria bacterium]|nr:fructosamine kinase family protein [Gammaproteobacteria bacterium]